MLSDGEVAVVAGDWADPFDGLFVRPRAFGVVVAPDVGPADEVEHDVQGGGIGRQQLFRGDAEKFGPDLADLFHALEIAVIAHVLPAGGGVIARARK